MAKGEIACFEQFLLLSQCFQNPSAAEASESVCMRERVNRNKGQHNLFCLTLLTILKNDVSQGEKKMEPVRGSKPGPLAFRASTRNELTGQRTCTLPNCV